MSAAAQIAATADRVAVLNAYAERFPTDRPVSLDGALDLLRLMYVPPKFRAGELAELVTRGLVVRQDDDTYLRAARPSRPEDKANTRSDNPEYAAFRAGVLSIVDERLRQLGLIS